jgi:hypothetical protein
MYGMAITDLKNQLNVAKMEISDLKSEITALQEITSWVSRLYTWMCHSARHFPWH